MPTGPSLEKIAPIKDTSMKISPIVAASTNTLPLGSDRTSAETLEHTPVEAYFVLRRLAQAPIEAKALFGFSNEGLVQFLISRGLAVQTGGIVSITTAGCAIGESADDRDGP